MTWQVPCLKCGEYQELDFFVNLKLVKVSLNVSVNIAVLSLKMMIKRKLLTLTVSMQ